MLWLQARRISLKDNIGVYEVAVKSTMSDGSVYTIVSTVVKDFDRSRGWESLLRESLKKASEEHTNFTVSKLMELAEQNERELELD